MRLLVVSNFEGVWKDYEQELSAFVLSRVRDKEIQKEVMQEVALKIFTSLHLQKKHLRGWLYMLTKNAINDYFRKENKPLILLEEQLDEPRGHLLSECLTPMLETLKDEEKEILSLTQLKQYSLAEVEQQKGLSHSAVKSRLFRAKKSLAQSFFSCCDYERNARNDVVDFSADKGCKC